MCRFGAPRCVFTIVVVTGGLGAGVPATALGGMPSVTPADIQRIVAATRLTTQRLEAISFFLVAFLIVAAAIRGIWNSLRRDFPRLPRLSYTRALGLVALWGLLFLIVLTM